MRALTLVLGNNQHLVAQLLHSALVLSQPLYSVYLTLSHATLNAFALVLVVKIVVAQLFAPQAGKTKRRQSTPEVVLMAKTRAVETHRRGARNAALVYGARQQIVPAERHAARGLQAAPRALCAPPHASALHQRHRLMSKAAARRSADIVRNFSAWRELPALTNSQDGDQHEEGAGDALGAHGGRT